LKAKDFLQKYQLQIAVGVVVIFAVASIYYVAKRNKKRYQLKLSPKQKKLVELADEDLKKWEGKTETNKDVSDTLISYWQSVGLNYTPNQVQSSVWQSSNPLSASYITSLIKKAGYNFKGGSAHSTYSIQGKKDRNDNVKNKYWAFRKSENKPVEIGDILVRNRDGGNFNFDTISSGSKSHGDVIIDIKKIGEKKVAIYQGGNLSNTVKRGQIELDNNGFLKSNSPYFLQLKFIEQ
jgi:hypothetical protein